MKRVFILVAILLLSAASNSIFSQSSLSEEEATAYAKRFNQAGGTYQIQIIDSRECPTIEVSLIDEIDNARKQDDVAYVYIKENIRIKVLPLSVINDENFVAVERIVFLNSSDL